MIFIRRNKAETLKQGTANHEELQTWSSKIETRATFLLRPGALLAPPKESMTPKRRMARKKSTESKKNKKLSSSSRSLTSTEEATSEPSFHHEEVNTRQRLVRFEKTGSVIQEMQPFTPEESASYWYNPSELKEMKHEAKLIAGLHAENKMLIDEHMCPVRGLEHFIEMASGQSAHNSRQAVLKVQKQSNKKKSPGKKNPKKKLSSAAIESRIQKAYAAYTPGSCIQARFLAMSDEVAAMSARS